MVADEISVTLNSEEYRILLKTAKQMESTYGRASTFWKKYEPHVRVWANIVQKLEGKIPQEENLPNVLQKLHSEKIEVTSVWVKKVEQGNVRAVASIALNGSFVIGGIKIIEGRNGKLFVAFPSRKSYIEQSIEFAYPVGQEFRQKICDMILDEYKRQSER